LASKSAAVIDEVVEWQQPPTWYDASNPVAGEFMSTHSVLSCNMHYFAVLSSPQSQSSSSNIGGGNNSSLEVLEMEEEEMMTTTVVESGIKSQA
jgi:hypothetical protein